MTPRIGPYSLVEELNEGGTNTAFVAVRHSKSGFSQPCELERLQPHLAHDPRFRAILAAETTAALRFSHPSAVRILDLDEYDGHLVMVSELVDGRPLSSLWSRLAASDRALRSALVAWIGLQLADLLEAAHAAPWAPGQSKGMFRGGLAPSDVILSFDGHVRVRGVGLGRSRMCLPPTREELPYRAPELFAQHKADHLTDVYGLGAVLFDAIRGRSSFLRDTVAETKRAVLIEQAPSLSRERPDVSRELARLLFSMMAKVPADRPSHLKDVARTLATELDRPHEAFVAELAELMQVTFPNELTAARMRRRKWARPETPLPSLESIDRPAEPFDVAQLVDAIVEASRARGLDEAVVPFVENTPDLRPAPHELLTAGQIVGERYRVREILGEGAASVVYRAEHTLLLKDFALKVLRPERSNSAADVERFYQEARAVCQLDDPNIVRVNDFGRTERGAPFFVMELVHGELLSDRLRRDGRLPPTEAIQIASSILRGLEHAHDAGLIHRDLKPENIMLVQKSEGVSGKILDFGVAQLGEGADTALCGTPRYMAPEQALGEKVDRRADLYAMGVVLHYMLTGVAPFGSGSTLQILSRVITADPPIIPSLDMDPAAADRLRTIIHSAMSKDPAGRPSSAALMRQQLVECVARPVALATSARSA